MHYNPQRWLRTGERRWVGAWITKDAKRVLSAAPETAGIWKVAKVSSHDYDVFLSYNDADELAVEGLARRLRDEGLHVFFDPWSLVPGVVKLEGLEKALKRSQACAIFLGPQGRSPWQNAGVFMALQPAVEERGCHIVPVLLPGADPADANTLPLFLSSRAWVDFRAGLEDAAAFHRLCCGVRGIPPDDFAGGTVEIDPDAIPPVRPLPPGSVMSIRPNLHFTGREEELRRLARLLDAEGMVAAIGQVAAATGLGGIGKTQLAAEYAHRYGVRYPGGVFWLNMEDPEAIGAQVAACGGPGGMNLDPFPEKQPEQVARVRQEWQKPLPRLLIFDNADDPRVVADWQLTTGGCRVLITSRRHDWSALPAVQCLPLDTLPRPDSRRLLLRRRAGQTKTTVEALLNDREVAAAADAICELLGDLPLALHLAGAYLADRHAVSVGGYLAELRSQPVLDNAALVDWVRDPSPTQHIQNVAATFRMSYDRLNPDDPTEALALRVFGLAGHCAPGVVIARELLQEAGRKTSEDSETSEVWGERTFHDGLARLEALGLVTLEADGGVRLHRLLAEFARHGAEEEGFAAVADAVGNGVRAINESGRPDRMTPPLLEHLWYLAERAETEDRERAGRLFNELGYHLWQVADLAGARQAYERALDIDEAVLGPEHPNVATLVNNLGAVLKELGDLAGARQAYERALAIDEAVFGPDHPKVATRVNNLGVVLQDLGDLAGARQALERALAIFEGVLGPEHPNVATLVNNLGAVLKELGDLAGARQAYERALAIDEAVFGPDHPKVATRVNNLGVVLQDLGDLAGARQALERALAIDEAVFGPDHPKVAISVNNLGGVLQDLGDLAGAWQACERALRIFEQFLGPEHPRTQQVRRNLDSLPNQP